jgi:hypothetical protein
VNTELFWRALLVQALAVVVLTGVLLALPLPDDFFEDWGFLAGPTAWLVCSLVSARVLPIPLGVVLFSALAGAVAGVIVMLVVSHWPGLIAALLVFAASCGGYGRAEAEESAGRQVA